MSIKNCAVKVKDSQVLTFFGTINETTVWLGLSTVSKIESYKPLPTDEKERLLAIQADSPFAK